MAARRPIWVLRVDGGDVAMWKSRGLRRKATKSSGHGDFARRVGPSPIRLWLRSFLQNGTRGSQCIASCRVW